MVKLQLFSYFLNHLIHLPRFRGRDRVIRFLSRFVTSALSAYGPRMVVRSSDITNQFALTATYGQKLPDLIRSMPKDGAFIDVGANLGIFTLIAADHLQKGIVISFEPNRHLFKDLLCNLELNAISNALPLNYGLGKESTVSYLSGNNTHSGKYYVAGQWNHQPAPPVLIGGPEYTSFLKDIVRGRETLVKIDVEGAELNVLMALSKSNILDQVSKIYVEINSEYLARFGHTPELLYDYLSGLNFAPEARLSGWHYDELFVRMQATGRS